MSVRSVAVLGSTGSIGEQTLAVCAAHPERFAVTALAAGSRGQEAAAQARAVGARQLALADEAAAAVAREALADTDCDVEAGDEAVRAVAGGGADVVVNGMVGSRGLRPTLAALAAGSRLALANKESLIVGGELVLDAARAAEERHGPHRLVPVDSEHSALAQLLAGHPVEEVERLLITASGGPFRGRRREQLADVGVADALAHPTWSMGAVITVSSATLANKGLEVIEAHLLFGVPYERITVVVHPQSVVHGMVELVDGATLAEVSPPDMTMPIQLALGWPERLAPAANRLDWTRARELTFEPVDADTFPMVELARAAGRAGGTAPAAFNAANEEAVTAFLHERLPFLGITEVVARTLDRAAPVGATDLATVLAAEEEARRIAREEAVRLGAPAEPAPGDPRSGAHQ